jgi:hypothetical protein
MIEIGIAYRFLLGHAVGVSPQAIWLFPSLAARRPGQAIARLNCSATITKEMLS